MHMYKVWLIVVKMLCVTYCEGMPESAHKRRLVSKLNEANGKGTPDVATSGSVRTTGKGTRQRRRYDL